MLSLAFYTSFILFLVYFLLQPSGKISTTIHLHQHMTISVSYSYAFDTVESGQFLFGTSTFFGFIPYIIVFILEAVQVLTNASSSENALYITLFAGWWVIKCRANYSHHLQLYQPLLHSFWYCHVYWFHLCPMSFQWHLSIIDCKRLFGNARDLHFIPGMCFSHHFLVLGAQNRRCDQRWRQDFFSF